MKYRALLVDPQNTKAERPVQSFSNNHASILDWANKMLPGAVGDDAAVLIYQTTEQQIAIITKVKPEAKP